MIPIREIGSAIHPARSPRGRIFLIFKFFCDESHDAPAKRKTECRSYVVGGLIGDEGSWDKIEGGWDRRNKLEGIPRYHATHLNAGTYEYEGWSKARRVAYSKEMLEMLKRPGKKMHAISIGLYVDEYRRLISPEGQVKMGPPWFVCFKAAICTVASQMDRMGSDFRPGDQFSVIIDQNDLDAEAIKVFYNLKQDPGFRHRHRLATCTAGSAEEFVGLQCADFVAYEAFRLLHGRRSNADLNIRAPLQAVLGKIGVFGLAFGADTLSAISADIDSRPCEPNGFVIIPPCLEEEEYQQFAKNR
jgi:Protein of unknown function (DUF3800)